MSNVTGARPLKDNAPVGDGESRASGAVRDVAECERLLRSAKRLLHAGELRASGEAVIRAGELARRRERPDLLAAAALAITGVQDPLIDAGVESMCRDAIKTVGPTNRPLLARLHAQLAIAQYHRGRIGDASTSSQRAMHLAVQTDDLEASAAALHARQMIAVGLVRPNELIDLGERMLELAGKLRSTDAEMLGHVWRTDGFLQLADTAAASREIDALDVLAARTGKPLVSWHALRSRAGWSQAVGALAEAERLAAAARDALPPSQAPLAMPLYFGQLTMVAVDRGVRPPGMDSMGSLAAGRFPVILATIGLLDLAVGDRGAALASLDGARSRLADLPRDERWLPTMAAMTELAVAFDDHALAGNLQNQLLPFEGLMVAAAIGAYGPVGYYLGIVDASAGRMDAAIARLQAAAELAARGDLSPSLVRTRVALADTLLKRGRADDRRRAANLIATATADASRLGMHALRARATALGASLDRLPGRLSPRERQIAAHVAAGRSNREIASVLVLSERTVETHVQNILNKLDLHSRAQVAAWATRVGITEDGT
jgi:DNA-binding NarL/FixJ family response regulator